MSAVNFVIPFSQKCIEALNEQIAMELNAFYEYRAIAYHFSQHSVALNNVAAKFHAMAKEELEHADVLSRYMQTRGGSVVFKLINVPVVDSAMTLLQAFERALVMEKAVHASLRKVHACAGNENEAQFASFIEDGFLEEQVKAEHELMQMITMIKRMGNGLGETLFDQQLK